MPQYKFTVAQNSISSGVPASDVEYTVDRGMTRQTEHRVLTSKFGDGYEQRVLDGINTKMESFSVSFKNRTRSSINLLAAFLDAQAGKNFTFTVTDQAGDSNVKVVCDKYNLVYNREDFHTLTTTFRRVYEP